MGFGNADVLPLEITRRLFDHGHEAQHLHVHIRSDDYREGARGRKLRASRGQVEQHGPGGGAELGNIAKLANQTIVAVNIAACAEAFTLAQKAGVDPEAVYKAIRGGLAGSTVMDAKVPMMLARNFNPGFRINLHIKDLGNVLDTGHGANAPLPLTLLVREMMSVLDGDGHAAEDHSSLVKVYEKLANIELAPGEPEAKSIGCPGARLGHSLLLWRSGSGAPPSVSGSAASRGAAVVDNPSRRYCSSPRSLLFPYRRKRRRCLSQPSHKLTFTPLPAMTAWS